MAIFDEQLSSAVLNRCHAPSDGDILVPSGSHSILGTTSINVNSLLSHRVEKWEIEKLLIEGDQMIPGLSNKAIMKTYLGIRPLCLDTAQKSEGRTLSRSFQVLNHKTTDNIDNFISVVGGKFIIYRLMAEKTVDEMCKNLNMNKPSQTATNSL